jgi:proline iminopeptidase
MSWGSTLGLAYAEAYPERVRALILALVTTTSRREVEWITREVGRIFPREWDRFAGAVPGALRHLTLVDAYATLLFDPDPAVRDGAAREWCAWEDAHVSLAPDHTRNPRYDDPEFRLRFARLVTHYWRHAAFLDDGQLFRGAHILNGIPGVLISGRFDVSGPLETAWRLSQVWTTSRLEVIGDTGHGGSDAFRFAVIDALIDLANGMFPSS